MRKFKLLIKPAILCLLSLFFCRSMLCAQQKKLNGVVQDSKTNAPLEGATIEVKGTKQTVTSSSGGKFSVEIKGDKAVLVVSYVGYQSQTVTVTAGQTDISVRMNESSSSQMSDVVVVGFQNVSRRKMTGAVSTLKGKELENLPAASVDQMMQGRVSGLNIQNFSGEPGTQGIVLIRGNTQIGRDLNEENPVVSNPLYIIDGIPYNGDDIGQFQGTGTNFLAGINPNDIESIDVLKDASAAALYGARGANGIIMITTKRAKSGKPTINLNAYRGVTEIPKLRQVLGGVEERRTKLSIIDQQYTYAEKKNNLPMILTDSLNPAFNNATNWQKLFYQNGVIDNYDLSISGGAPTASYRVSLGYYNEEGVVKNYGFKRYSFSSTLNLKPTEKLNIQAVMRYSYIDRKAGSDERRTAVPLEPGNMLSSLLYLSDDGYQSITGASRLRKDKRINHSMNLNVQGTYQLNSDFTLQTRASLALYPSRRDRFLSGQITSNGLAAALSEASEGMNSSLTTWLTYSKAIKSLHNVVMTVGNSFEYEQNKKTAVGGTNMVSDLVQVVQGVSQDYLFGGSDISSRGLLSYYAQFQYDFASKYIFGANFRADASSRFGKDNRWAYFPSLSAGWIISDENFMKNSKLISYLKLRASWGVSGVEPPARYGYYLAYNKYTAGAGSFSGQADNSQTYNGTVAVQPDWTNGVAQDKLSWVNTNQLNIGLDANFGTQSRLKLELDGYIREVKNGFFEFTLPYHTGYERIQTNGVGMRNMGVEVTISSKNLSRSSQLQWNTRLTLARNKDIITKLPDDNRDLYTGGFYSNNKLVVGRSANLFNLIQYLGVYSTEADIPVDPLTGNKISYIFRNSPPGAGWARFLDANGDYFIKDDKTSAYGDFITQLDPNPAVIGGLLNDFIYKNWNLSVNCVFTLDRDIQNNSLVTEFWDNITFGGLGQFAGMSISNYADMGVWLKPGDNAKYPRIPLRTDNYTWNPNSSIYMDKGSYFRVKTIQLGYSLNQRVLDKIKLKGVRLYGTLDNVLMIQNAKTVPDAEQVNFYGYYDGQSYPIPKKVTIGLNVTL